MLYRVAEGCSFILVGHGRPKGHMSGDLTNEEKLLFSSSLPFLLSFSSLWVLCSVVLVVSDSATPWPVAHQAPLSMGFSLQYWSGLPCPFPGVLPNPGLQTCISCITGEFFTCRAIREAPLHLNPNSDKWDSSWSYLSEVSTSDLGMMEARCITWPSGNLPGWRAC